MTHTVRFLCFASALIFVPSVGTPGVARAQDPVSAANTAHQQEDWATSAKLYDELSRANPTNPRYWYRLGIALQAMGRNAEALHDFHQAHANGLPVALVGFDMARAYIVLGQKDSALAMLTEAVQQGYAQPERLTGAPELQPLHNNPRFTQLVDRATRNQKPCDYSVESRQFDFWVGEWDVVDASSGTTAGSSRIEKALGDCVIWENWTSAASPYAGKSYNVYNPALTRWEQFWVDNVGGSIHFYGGFKDGVMDFYTDEIPQSDGTRLKRHLQFFSLAPDTVRQFSRGSNDGGKTWKVEYDLRYTRKKSASSAGDHTG